MRQLSVIKAGRYPLLKDNISGQTPQAYAQAMAMINRTLEASPPLKRLTTEIPAGTASPRIISPPQNIKAAGPLISSLNRKFGHRRGIAGADHDNTTINNTLISSR